MVSLVTYCLMNQQQAKMRGENKSPIYGPLNHDNF